MVSSRQGCFIRVKDSSGLYFQWPSRTTFEIAQSTNRACFGEMGGN